MDRNKLALSHWSCRWGRVKYFAVVYETKGLESVEGFYNCHDLVMVASEFYSGRSFPSQIELGNSVQQWRCIKPFIPQMRRCNKSP